MKFLGQGVQTLEYEHGEHTDTTRRIATPSGKGYNSVKKLIYYVNRRQSTHLKNTKSKQTKTSNILGKIIKHETNDTQTVHIKSVVWATS